MAKWYTAVAATALVAGSVGSNLYTAATAHDARSAIGVSADPTTARGDTVYRASALPDAGLQRLAIGEDASVLTSINGVPVWRAAAGGSSMDPSVTTYSFGDSTGVTLTNRSGTAAVSAAALVLSATTGVDHYTGTWTAPSGGVAIPALSDGRGAMRVRARGRVAAITPGGNNPNVVAYLALIDASGQRHDVDVDKSGNLICERNDSGPTSYGFVSSTGAITTALAGGTLVLEIEAQGTAIECRYSTDSGTSWTRVGHTVAATTHNAWSSATATMYTASPGAGGSTVRWDDLAVTVWP